jgi:hypothetical protein
MIYRFVRFMTEMMFVTEMIRLFNDCPDPKVFVLSGSANSSSCP